MGQFQVLRCRAQGSQSFNVCGFERGWKDLSSDDGSSCGPYERALILQGVCIKNFVLINKHVGVSLGRRLIGPPYGNRYSWLGCGMGDASAQVWSH